MFHSKFFALAFGAAMIAAGCAAQTPGTTAVPQAVQAVAQPPAATHSYSVQGLYENKGHSYYHHSRYNNSYYRRHDDDRDSIFLVNPNDVDLNKPPFFYGTGCDVCDEDYGNNYDDNY